MEDIKDYICDKCNTEMSIMELGYLGSDDESCSPFTQLTCLCKKCYNDRESGTEDKNS
jgi:hypothetical protein